MLFTAIAMVALSSTMNAQVNTSLDQDYCKDATDKYKGKLRTAGKSHAEITKSADAYYNGCMDGRRSIGIHILTYSTPLQDVFKNDKNVKVEKFV